MLIYAVLHLTGGWLTRRPHDSISTQILMCLHVPKKSMVLACLTMSKLKMNQHVHNKSADLLKKIGLMGTVPHGP